MTVPSHCHYHFAGDAWSKLKIEDMINPPQNWISSKGCFAALGMGPDHGDPNGTDMAAYPVLSYPPDVLTLDPKWAEASCFPGPYYFGLEDPPTALTPVSALVTVSTTLETTPTSASLNTPDVHHITNDPTPGNVVTIIPVAQTSSPFNHLDPPSDPDSPSNPAPSSYPAPPSDPDLPSNPGLPSVRDPSPHPDPPLNLDFHPTALPEKPVENWITTKLTMTTPYTSKDSTNGLPQSPFLLATVGPQQVYALPNGDVSVQGMTAEHGHPTMTVDGTPISVDAGSIYIGGSRYELPTPLKEFALPPSAIDGHYIEAASAGAILFGERILSEGQHTTVDGHAISNGQGRMNIDGTSFAKPSYDKPVPTAKQTPLPTIIGTMSLNLNQDGALLLDGTTMSPGQQTTIDGKRVAIKTGEVVIDSTTYNRPALPYRVAAQSTIPGESTGQSNNIPMNTLNSPPPFPSSFTSTGLDQTTSSANNNPPTTPNTPSIPDNEPGLRTIVMSAFGNMASKTTTASPAAESEGRPPALPTISGFTPSRSGGLGKTVSGAMWVTMATISLRVLL
ncbi:MAG: hypothetical protein L6R42_006993 [Xanthoria sp. 1 TBL-2021]|nr:MAG: hypothetical protein L6R42_006993 [Xanthoria sp. 1 TBL-2021]